MLEVIWVFLQLRSVINGDPVIQGVGVGRGARFRVVVDALLAEPASRQVSSLRISIKPAPFFEELSAELVHSPSVLPLSSH
ncbi:MAG: hypothetical protein WC829_03230 [Hyphomicrobium sp.]|jgi:hypothetical protein